MPNCICLTVYAYLYIWYNGGMNGEYNIVWYNDGWMKNII